MLYGSPPIASWIWYVGGEREGLREGNPQILLHRDLDLNRQIPEDLLGLSEI